MATTFASASSIDAGARWRSSAFALLRGYLSTVVTAELRAGAGNANERRALDRRVLSPYVGGRRRGSLGDCLIAAAAVEAGARLAQTTRATSSALSSWASSSRTERCRFHVDTDQRTARPPRNRTPR